MIMNDEETQVGEINSNGTNGLYRGEFTLLQPLF